MATFELPTSYTSPPHEREGIRDFQPSRDLCPDCYDDLILPLVKKIGQRVSAAVMDRLSDCEGSRAALLLTYWLPPHLRPDPPIIFAAVDPSK